MMKRFMIVVDLIHRNILKYNFDKFYRLLWKWTQACLFSQLFIVIAFCSFENITPILRITILLIWYICYFEVTSKLLMIARKIYILRCKYLNWYFIISKNNLHYQKNNIVILLRIVQVRMQNENENKNWFGLDFTVSQINNFSFIEDIIIL